MSTTVTQEDSFSGFDSKVESIIRLALRLKWTGRWTTSQHQMVKLHAPGEVNVDILVPSTNVGAKRQRAMVNKIIRYANPYDVLFEAEMARNGTKVVPDSELARAVAEATAKVGPPTEPEPEPAPTSKTRRSGRKHGKSQALPAPKPTPPSNTVLPAPPKHDPVWREQEFADALTEVDEPTVVSSVPWLVRGGSHSSDGSGTMYESPHTLEQLMSDGTTRYKCKQCPYVSDEGKRVSWHAGQKHGKNRTREMVKVAEYGDVEPRNLKPRLLSDILGALDSIEDWQSMSKEALAEKVAALIIEARPDRAPAEPLTAEQMIERIRYMVDGPRIGAMHDEVAQLRTQYTETLARAETAEKEAAAAKAQTDKVRADLRALDSMMKDVIGDDMEGSEAS